MASLTINTTPRQDNALSYALQQENSRRAAQTPPLPPLTAAQYFNQLVNSWLDSYEQQAVEMDAGELKAAMQAATPAKRSAAKAAALAALA